MTTKRIDVASAGFSDDDSPPASNLSSMQRAIVTIQKLRAKVEGLERIRTEPIAIVGMACRFPGGANTPEEFFRLLDEGIDAVTEVPPNRWRLEQESADSEGEARSLRWGAFLNDVDQFDPAFFGISPREAESLDPQQRLLLEVSWEALERAGQLPERLMGTKTGVFVGIWSLDYQQRVIGLSQDKLDAYCFTGNVMSTAAGRLAYTMGLQGPCMSIETACSSSLTATHLACQSLRMGESSLALAGGVNLMLSPTTTNLLSKTQALSPDGRCKTFDARANGFVRGEGCGMLVLKRLSDAERDGDTILALIRGSAVNQDGRSTGLTAPNVLSQQALLRQALENARISPQEVGYVETHGTGTSLGDPIEVEAIKTVLGAPRERGASCVLGALKSNIGHLEAAAGVAGLMKVVLAMQNDKIPGNLHFRSLNPRIDLAGTSLEIAQTAKPWAPGIRPRYAGVSAFGISGTNAHVILEEAPRNLEEALFDEETSSCLLPISAKTPEALRAHAQAYREMLVSEQSPRLLDIVHTASARRSHYVHRVAVVGRTKDEMADELDTYLRGKTPTGVAEGRSTPARAKVVFVFSGQGSQWIGMGRQLYATDSSFRSVIDTCDNLMTSRLNWSILDEFDTTDATSRMSETQVAQPLLFAVQIALVEMLRSWGISPDAMIGHSIGEISAAHIAGILSLDEAIRLVAIRGRIMQKATGMGKMVAISTTPAEAMAMIAGYENRVSIAAINDPGSIVLSGQASAVDDVVTRCEKRGYKSRPLRVNYPFHSPQMDTFERELVERLTRVDARRATLAMYSTVLADCVDGKELDAHYWGRNVRSTVDFAGAVFAAIRDGYQLFLEVGPHPELVNSIQRCFTAKHAEGYALGTLRHGLDDRRALLETAGGLYTRGCTIEWSRILPNGGRCVPLPTYPWQREHFWVDPSPTPTIGLKKRTALRQKNPAQRPNVVFVFPGQGSQWLGMGQQLLANEPAFRTALEACDEAIRKECDFSVLAELQADDLTSRLDEIDVVQPLLFAIEVALATLWRAKGVEPDCVVGHSMGEVAAAHIAGILTLDDAAKVICRRSQLLTNIRGRGAMALVELPMVEAEEAIVQHRAQLSIAVSNGPRSTVISGDAAALNEVLATLEARGVYCKHVKVDIASHSPQVDPLLDDLLARLWDVHATSSSIRMQSTVTGGPVVGSELDATYWVDNLRQPVRFSEVTQRLINDGFRIFIEMSPHPILLPSIEENLKAEGAAGVVVASMRRQTPERQTLAEALDAVVRHKNQVEGKSAVQPPMVISGDNHGIDDPHPLLGWKFTAAVQPDLHIWEVGVNLEAFPYLAAHCVQDEVVFPGAAFVEMALAAGRHLYDEHAFTLDEISFAQMLAIPKDGSRIVQLSLLEEDGGRAIFTISSKPDGAKDWLKHVTGALRAATTATTPPSRELRADAEARCPNRMSSREHYQRMTARGLSYGTEFQGVAEVHVGNDEIVARVRMPNVIVPDAESYLVHPALLDACFQAAFWSTIPVTDGDTFVPVKATGIRTYGRPGQDVWVHARRSNRAAPGEHATSIVVRDDNWRPLVEIGAIHLHRLAVEKAREKDQYNDCVFEVAWRKSERDVAQADGDRIQGPCLVLLDRRGFGAALTEQLRTRNPAEKIVEVIPGDEYAALAADIYRLDPTNLEHWNRLLGSAFGKVECRTVIHCCALDGAHWQETTEITLAADLRQGPWSTLRLAQALLKQGWRNTPRLYVLTRAGQTVTKNEPAPSVVQSAQWGLGRVIAMEQPDLGCVRIDLAAEPYSDELAQLLREIACGDDEDQVALRPDGRYVARLARGSFEASNLAPKRTEPAAGRPYRLEIHEPGVLDRLALYPMERRPPGPDEVEIEVESAGLNFIDVMKAMGIYPGMDQNAIELGTECAGRIVGIGSNVKTFRIGQEVIAAAPSSFATYVTTSAGCVIAKPAVMSFNQAATIPAVFMTAYWALHHLGRLRRGESILIHAASGGTGLAALQYAQSVGAEIFATAGSESKRAYLRSLGVRHVMDSRTLSFADEIAEKTGGRGVDVVLNSLAGEAALKGLEALAPYGRFLELGKKDIYQNKRLGLLPFRKSISYSAIDLAGMRHEKPELYTALLHEVLDEFAKGTFQPTPVTEFSVGQAGEAFQLMAQAQHIGKIAIQVKDADAYVTYLPANLDIRVRPERTYLITGGLGGLGLSLARGLVTRGAKHLALVGRSEPNNATHDAIREMESTGAQVRTLQANVAKRTDVEALFATIEREMPALCGVVHAAGLLDDRTITEMNESEFFHPMEPKVFGGWNLHLATRHLPLDFFVVYSSIAGLLGSPGQANYAAANTFLDALCQGRAADGLPATSIQWGVFADVGLAAAKDVRGKRLAARGSASFKPEEGIALFTKAIEQPRVEVGLMHFDVRQWVEFYPQVAGAPFLSELASEKNSSIDEKKATIFRDVLENAQPAQRATMVEEHLAEQLGKVLRLDPKRIDKQAPFTTLGMDSLMSLELRNRLEASLGMKLSAALLFTYSTTVALATHLVGKLFAVVEPQDTAPATLRAPTGIVSSDVSSDQTRPTGAIHDQTTPTAAADMQGETAEVQEAPDLVDKLEAFEEYLK